MGIYQIKNIVTVLQAIAVANNRSFAITDDALQQGLRNTKKLTGLHGRWEVVHRHPTIILEVAHNEAGLQQMLEHLKFISYRKLHLVLGFVKDKEIDKALRLLPQEATFYFTHAHIPRALDATTLQQKAAAYQLHGTVHHAVNDALVQALQHAMPDDLIVVCGSIFLVAEVDAAKWTTA